jgi:uncharacterized membrane-anchored protein YjiN (DUF445 family)
MAARERIGRVAVASLGLALLLVAAGKLLEHAAGWAFVGGLLTAFGEAALVGGLADWFAVRALFAHPFGIPFPHTAIIPRNRRRLTAEIRNLVVNEWLPRDILARKVEAFDFVGQALLPALPTMRPHLRDLLRAALHELLTRVEPRQAAEWVAGGVREGIQGRQVAPWLAELVRQARAKDWLEPLVREMVRRLEQWASSPTCRRVVRERLEKAAETYRQRGSWQDLVLTLGQVTGGVDLAQATGAIQGELARFASEQLEDESQMRAVLRETMIDFERRLRDDPTFLDGVSQAMKDSQSLTATLTQIVASLRDEALTRVEADESPWLELAMRQADAWMERLAQDEGLKARVNGWLRGFVTEQLERHHEIIGVLVEEQMNRLSDESMTELIQKRVGEDLNWIRLNGTFVGGLIGVALFLLVELVRWASK